ncbi:MAG: hypothetical protein JRJ24_15735 [Deltaproteobacteria bacterium]|nr:hypothetical protein [Deltaproteobacteria bacterium]
MGHTFLSAERAAAQALTESYWSIGKRIAKEKLNTRAGYHNAILADLSEDLGIGIRTLQRTVTFYQTYKRPPRLEGLSWAHYRILMQLQDPRERGFYAFNNRGIGHTFSKGRYLNQELIDKGFAKLV